MAKNLSFAAEQTWQICIFNLLEEKMLDFERLKYRNYLTHRKLRGVWKDNVGIFHLMPISSLCDHWFGHRVALKTGLIL